MQQYAHVAPDHRVGTEQRFVHIVTWAARSVTGRTWGGCLEVIQWILTAVRFPFEPGVLEGGVLIIETSEELLPARDVGWIVRLLGDRGVLDAVLVQWLPGLRSGRPSLRRS